MSCFWQTVLVRRPLTENARLPGHRGQILRTLYLMNYLSNLEEAYGELPTTPTDDLIGFWRSKVKVTARHQGGVSKYVF